MTSGSTWGGGGFATYQSVLSTLHDFDFQLKYYLHDSMWWSTVYRQLIDMKILKVLGQAEVWTWYKTCNIRRAARQQLEGTSDMAQYSLAVLIRAHYDFVKVVDSRGENER